ncbi:competence protein ComGA [Levilactobacillus bambusae]|uniref:Competence protein ComGA n=1 Tax=Levilactobacillus bambusae TaxID=2024736 RepID=A0A2V1MZW6_9LACO|nr:competence protein ComGA [Levilactobacillus bambusae]
MEAMSVRASDIYLRPTQSDYRWRIRCRNQLTEEESVPTAFGQQILTYLKFHANMSITESRRPQLGAWEWQIGNERIELRLSTVGDYLERESMVIRLIYPLEPMTLQYLIPNQQQELQLLTKQRGLIVFAGPTGSGKTTTMYALARRLAQDQIILTIEDPVEIKEPNFLQLQLNEGAGLTYNELLKVALRHRPDVFIIGEIRDRPTAKAAVRAALSGHLVLSTVHARTASGVQSRLLDLGAEQRDLEEALTAVSYQRLIPTKQGLGLLSDIWRPPFSTVERQMSEGWRRCLMSQEAKGMITREVASQFANG